ncbi:RNA 2',3'-cyclic phosphodiesterase [Mangrovibacillus sp. Mu-81]|jgi:RNA 2',3'-cyclic 3'-phosphodiesterase|uniref:RNA 2',3'-cyclic phosphodiesterase n=1 Tax=Mangrovibacillus sp. Mu-81 TaxID=3121478 RepID=UPI002FE4BF08
MLDTHYFFALSLPDDMKEVIHEMTAPMRKREAFKKWVHPDDYHITLAFLGNAPQDDLESAIDKAESTLCNREGFTLSCNRFGTFGKEDQPRILWMGVNPCSGLHQIREEVYGACEEAGFQLDTRPFAPHITIGRKWNLPTSFLKEWLSGFNTEDTGFHHIKEVVLYKTHMDRTPKYEAVHAIQLKDPS